jgi:hypothetical protein
LQIFTGFNFLKEKKHGNLGFLVRRKRKLLELPLRRTNHFSLYGAQKFVHLAHKLFFCGQLQAFFTVLRHFPFTAHKSRTHLGAQNIFAFTAHKNLRIWRTNFLCFLKIRFF